ncbi:pR87 [rat cytomegalovirus strain Maastricht]|uniref:PR87 n=1 Tax=Rat cytomegalovirus (strain Maastricht) TaxID=79700 RepID=Q9DWB5_RCMVM|nr:pR87 [rat cytomegalovirus strain Maastricht]AAF99175.1 pR87 [rat cytomegalovirus strain Maastricht]WEG72008.1 protein UL87 [Murid betaherpesvirus 2]
MSASGGSPVSRAGSEPALIVKSPAARVKNAPVCVNSHNLTREIAPFEDSRLAQPVAVDEDHITAIFRLLMAAGPDAGATEEDRARVVLCRLLLGPVAVPCYCDDWDVDDYMARCAYRCSGPALYVHRARCRCGADGGGTMFTLLHDHYTTHVFRGLLSLAEWNVRLVDVFCACNRFRSDRYVMAVLPKHFSVFIAYYPYFLVCLARYLTVPEIDDCVGSMTAHLGPQIAARVGTHYKMLFGANVRPARTLAAGRANYDFFLLELQKLWLHVSYRNAVTRDFFEVVFAAFHRETGRVMLALRSPGRVALTPSWFSVSRFRKQVLYFELAVRCTKSKRESARNALVHRKTVVAFADADVVWRNLFYVYYTWGEGGRPAAAAPPAAPLAAEAPAAVPVSPGEDPAPARGADGDAGRVPPGRGEAGAPRAVSEERHDVSVAARQYVRIVDRLALVRLRHREWLRFRESVVAAGGGAGAGSSDGVPGFDFDPVRGLARHRAADAPSGRADGRTQGGRKIIGGREFAEMTAVSLNRVAVNAFNTNRVINLKATVSRDGRLSAFRVPRNMTHSFVMYKHTFKEPPYTVSTFVSNDAAHTNSLNVNIRGSYQEFLYALTVYRLYVGVENFFLPAAVCNSNSSLDVHGIEDQGVIRSERDRVYWTTNFPCMISNTNNINVGWFKAATAIVPKVSGLALENVLLKELTYVTGIEQLCVDYALHRVFTVLETRNCYQIPFLSKQFILFLRVAMLRACGLERRLAVDRLVFRAMREGVFDYHKNTVAHTKIKHTCALIGTRLANNVPKVLVNRKKVKLDYLGRNANLLTICRYVDQACVDAPRLAVLLGVLDCLEALTTTDKTKEAVARARARLRGGGGSGAGGDRADRPYR